MQFMGNWNGASRGRCIGYFTVITSYWGYIGPVVGTACQVWSVKR